MYLLNIIIQIQNYDNYFCAFQFSIPNYEYEWMFFLAIK